MKRSSVFCFCLLFHPQSYPKTSRDEGQLWHRFKRFPWVEVSPGRWRWDVHFKERHIFHQLPVFPSNRMAAEKSSLEVKIQSCKSQLSLATRRSRIAQVGVVSSFFFSFILGVGDATSLSSLLYICLEATVCSCTVLVGPGLGFWRRLGVNYSTTTLRKGHNFTCWTVCCLFSKIWALYLTNSLVQKPKEGPGNGIILLQRECQRNG